MASPLKPWEQNTDVLNRNIPTSTMTSFSGPGLGLPHDNLLNDGNFGGGFGGVPITTQSPPIPPRPATSNEINSMNRFGYGNGMYSSMYSSPYNSYSPYSSFGGYGGYSGFGGYGGMGYGGGYSSNYQSNNEFIQSAESNYRQAFQSIESVVHAVGSVSAMLESTFYSLHSSFRAVIGVADQFGRMKMQMGQILSIFSLFRSLRWLYRKALSLLGIIPPDMENEIWTNVEDKIHSELLNDKQNKNKIRWPIFLFLALIFGTPWLIWKLLMLTVPQPPDHSEWAQGKIDHVVAIALHDFKGENDREISFRAGTQIKLAPKELQPNVRSWLLASIDGKTTGLIPANYVKLLGKVKGSNVDDMNCAFDQSS